MKLTPSPVVKAPRRKLGRGSQVTPAERREIQHWTTSAGLRTTGKGRVRFGIGITTSQDHGRVSVTR